MGEDGHDDGPGGGGAGATSPVEALDRLRAEVGAAVGGGGVPAHLGGGGDGDGLVGVAGAVRSRLGAWGQAAAARPPWQVAAWLAAVVAVVVGTGLWWWRSSAAPTPVAFVPTTAVSLGDAVVPAPGVAPPGGTAPVGAAPASAAPAEVVVHAAGAVAAPGVYRLSPSSRVGDLVAAAGGLVADADADQVNLAAPLVDGSRVHVPRRGEAPAPAPPGPGDPAGQAGATATATATDPGGQAAPADLVDLNGAGPDALDELPGVGPATAAAIVEHRRRHGRFGSVDELLDVTGIGPAKLERLRPLVRV